VRSTPAFPTTSFIVHQSRGLLALLVAFVPLSATAGTLSLEDAIRSAWKNNLGIAASASAARAAHGDVAAAREQRLPSLLVSAKALATNEPVAAFGLKLDQQRIGMADFDPSRLNYPNTTGAFGMGAALVQPLYMGDRLSSGARAAARQAEAEDKQHERRKQEIAFQVAQAYFGSQVAEEGVRYAEDVLAQAKETESFTRARNREGLVLDADVARATAFRAQAEAERATAAQRLASARSALALLTGDDVATAELSTPLVADQAHAIAMPSSDPLPLRADLESARLRAEAAREMVKVSAGSLKPEVMAQAAVETLRSAFDQGATWFTVGVFARWKLSASDWQARRAAEDRAGAAAEARSWQEQQARHEVEEAWRALETSRAKLASAHEAVSASQSARSLRIERHRQGLLPLTDVLDAEAALAGARTLLLRSQFDARVAAAELQLALGQPIEGVK
jgi:outer membrane protein TolC